MPKIETDLDGFSPIDLYERREKIITRRVQGKYQRLRFYTGWPLLVAYFVTPWLTWNDRQAVLFDLPARQFHIFGINFWPQDLWLLAWILMIAAFGLFTVTNVVGRIWCGYSCPQTVWTAIFMWIEQKAEGSRHQRIRLENAPMSWVKLRKRATKHAAWAGFAFLTGLTFVGYFTPITPLVYDIATLSFVTSSGWTGFWIVFLSVATYLNAGWLREQVCIYMCPYARFQSAMIDRDTLIVSYDPRRGEPRGAQKRSQHKAAAGDCVDCKFCVQVCPTGIDIRQGLQYQCIGCAHCIDACDQVMAKTGKPSGLISYTTLNALDGGVIKPLRWRSMGYASVCLLIIGAFIFAILNRTALDMDILRDRGVLYSLKTDGSIGNDYQLKLMNKSNSTTRYQVRVVEPAWITIASNASLEVPPGEISNFPLTLVTPKHTPYQAGTTVTLETCAKDNECTRKKTRFLMPPDDESQPNKLISKAVVKS